MRMGTYHGALLLVLAIVMAVLSTGICTAPVSSPAPAPSLEESKPTCTKILANSGCDSKVCHDNCFIKLKGRGVCFHDQCWCMHTCTLLLPPPPAQ